MVFGKALRKATSAIQDPEESIKDETLMAILLLGFYEVGIMMMRDVRRYGSG